MYRRLERAANVRRRHVQRHMCTRSYKFRTSDNDTTSRSQHDPASWQKWHATCIVQIFWTKATMSTETTYSESEITQRLGRELPHWYHESGTIRRKYRTEGWKGTLMVVNAIGHLAEAAWHHPDLTVSYAYVVVKLVTHSAKGITDKDFALARKIEDVIHWQPGL